MRELVGTDMLLPARTSIEHALVLFHKSDAVYGDLNQIGVRLNADVYLLGHPMSDKRHARRHSDIANHRIIH